MRTLRFCAASSIPRTDRLTSRPPGRAADATEHRHRAEMMFTANAYLTAYQDHVAALALDALDAEAPDVAVTIDLPRRLACQGDRRKRMEKQDGQIARGTIRARS